MKELVLMAATLMAFNSQAETIQVFGNAGPCYSWSGGYKSAGSFNQCNTDAVVVRTEPQAAPAVAPPPVPKVEYVYVDQTPTPAPHRKKVIIKPKHKPVECK